MKHHWSTTHKIAIILGILVVVWIVYELFINNDNKYEMMQNKIKKQNETIQLNNNDSNQKAELSNNNPFVLYYFYSPECPCCQKFRTSWNIIAEKINTIGGISVYEVNGNDPKNDDLMFYYNIKKYPTIILSSPEKNAEYFGNYSVNDIYAFIIKEMSNYVQSPHSQ